TTTFTVRFTPTSGGAKTATISIANNDADENPYDLTITGTGTAPEMALSQGATPIADGGSYGYGNQVLNSNTDVVFTITNSGTSNLTLTTPITIGGADAGQFSIQAQPTSPVASGPGTTTFTVRFTPTTTGAKTATISIANNDADENPYDLTITGTGTEPEMALSQGATPIADGGSHGFGSQALNSNTDVVFTITNSGTSNLTLTTPITIGGADAGQFSIQAQPTSPVTPGGGTTTFTVRFTPTTTGAKTATISIANNDADENPYDLTITGTGTAPEMALSQGATPIADGGSHDFGSQALSTDTDVVFTITNSGAENLTLTTPITIGGADAGEFSIQAQPTSPVTSGGGTTTFTVRFTPTTTGAKTATISIANNDADENPYDLTITGTGTAPEMALSQGATPIADGGGYDFGSQALSTDTDVVFTITNSGAENLTLTTPITIGGADAGEFSIQAQPTSPVASGGGTTTFTVRFTPTSEGAKTAAISIANNDGDENPYDLTLQGTGQGDLPTVTTAAVSDISSSSATSGGNVTDNGGTAVTSRGVCWSTSTNPTTADDMTVDGTGTGAFTSSLTGLAENTTYYVRAYAVNSQGTAYGSQVSFTTNAESATVTITNPSDGDEVSGTVTITASTTTGATSVSETAKKTDAAIMAVSKVEFYIDDVKVSEDTDAPYEYSWDTTTAADGSHTIKAVVYNAANQTSQDEITVTVTNAAPEPPEIALNRTQLNFGVLPGSVQTGSQTVLIDNMGGGTLDWTAAADAGWVSVSPASGTGSGVVTVSVDPTGLEAGTYTASVTVADTDAVNSPQTTAIRLMIYGTGTDLPFGYFETPLDGSTVMSSVPVTGWALDDIEVTDVKIYRSPLAGEGSGLVYIGDAVFVDGARPDVEQAFPDMPFNYRAGWGYMLLTNFLPNQGNGTFTLHATATDKEGNVVTLGSKTITCDNANAVKPFGAIDTPAQGGDASGSTYMNYGWVLTPQPNMIPTDGSTITVWVDGVSLGHPVYNLYRSDIAGLFPGYANSDGAVGYYYLDATAYANGVHTIAWSAEDNAGNSDGIGSRFFSVVNVGVNGMDAAASGGIFKRGKALSASRLQQAAVSMSPVYVKKGYSPDEVPEAFYPDEEGITTIVLREDERVEIHLNDPDSVINNRYGGSFLFGDRARRLPLGSTLDVDNGIFYWQPGPAFFGHYLLAFVEKNEAGETVKKPIKIVITTKFQ
ncbi:MAG: choice-of-anchor D domain-containing protein, partial [bacterium]|nr:choice-of-anchor D domain-containing protein [bacterium]